ncbi:twin-arginine translocase subunit TatC [Chondromyces crocatus]|uniref:Sec-independent protein translocase protein TatC n=1 Tax=Chondromyces crocatus TaxID=52 RepID=A0A0K1EJZ9_CHOCO|nr:twin-arginine translocase subunit TatC [Chondromyces crocatus]AKT40923.1 preprotein translocase subunit TatC [Chondromyces crocatus]
MPTTTKPSGATSPPKIVPAQGTQPATPPLGGAPKVAALPAVAQRPAPKAPEENEEDDADGDKPMSFWEHMDELRSRLVRSLIAFFVATLVTWNYHQELMHLLSTPFKVAWAEQGLPGEGTLHFGAPAVPFAVYFKLSMIGGALVVSPYLFYQLWSFIAPGLYAREKKFVIPFVASSTILFVGGAVFAYYTAVPLSLSFFLGLSGQLGEGGITITPTVMMGDYVEYIGLILLGFGLVFELPLLLLFLSIAGVVNYLHLLRFGRWFVLVAFIVAAILTPPEVISQLVMAGPMCVLYLLSIGLVYLFGKPPTEEQKAEYRAARERDKAKAT